MENLRFIVKFGNVLRITTIKALGTMGIMIFGTSLLNAYLEKSITKAQPSK